MIADKKIISHDEDQEVLDAFLKRASFPYGWLNLESSARRMVEHAVYEIETLITKLDAAEVRIGQLLCERSDYVQKVMDERDSLRAELDRLKKQEPVATVQQYRNGVDAHIHRYLPAGTLLYLAAGAQPDAKELDALRADAERYRWLDANGLFAQPQGYDTQIGIASPNDPVGILYVSNFSTHIASKAIDAARTAP